MFKKAYKEIRPRLAGTFLAIVVYCVPVNALTWYLGLVDDLSARISISVLVAMMPALEVLSLPRPLKSRRELLWFALFIVPVILLATGQKFNWGGLTANTAMVLVVLPWGWLVWQLMRRDWLLLTGLILALAVMMIYWIAALIQTQSPLELLLFPLLTVTLVGLIWTPFARGILDIAQRRKVHRISGPGTQALTMATLFLPVILVAVAVPGMLELSQIWSAVSLTIVGVLLSAVVSDPLRRFLLEWGNLSRDLRIF